MQRRQTAPEPKVGVFRIRMPIVDDPAFTVGQDRRRLPDQIVRRGQFGCDRILTAREADAEGVTLGAQALQKSLRSSRVSAREREGTAGW